MSNRSLFSRKLGKYNIKADEIHRNPGKVSVIIGTTVPIKAEYLFENDSIEYTALSHSFEAVPEGSMVPRYKIVLENEKFIRWEKE